MNHGITPAHLLGAFIFGSIAAYLAYRNKKNPYIWFLLGFFFGVLGVFFLFFLSKRKKNPEQNIPTGPQFLGPTDKLWFYLDPTHEQVGPVSYKTIKDALEQGTLNQTTYVWHEDLSDWKRLKEFIVL